MVTVVIRIMLASFVFAIILNLNSCEDIGRAPLSKREDVNYWQKTPSDWKALPTLPPSLWIKSTRRPFFWERFTPRPFEKNRDIFPENNYHLHHTDDSSIKMAIFLPITFGIIIALLCKYFVCNRRNRTQTSTPILHPPPRRVVPPPAARVQQYTPQNVYGGTYQNPSQSLQIQTERRIPTAPIGGSPLDNYQPTYRTYATDKPPDYSEVVFSDLRGGQNIFPEVNPIIPEAPPPSYYDEKNARKY